MSRTRWDYSNAEGKTGWLGEIDEEGEWLKKAELRIKTKGVYRADNQY